MYDAAQRREIRERRERLREGWMVGRDAYLSGNIATGKAKPTRNYRPPSYLSDPDEVRRGLSGKELWDAIDAFENDLKAPVH